METVVALIRIIVGLAFVVYGVVCIVAGVTGSSGCLLWLINLVVGPLITGVMVLIFPQIVDEVMTMDESGMVIIAILVLLYIVPVIASFFEREWIAGILNGLGFISVGMILSGVVPGPIIMVSVGIVAKLFGIIGIPFVILMFILS